jgi:hypothetical protein
MITKPKLEGDVMKDAQSKIAEVVALIKPKEKWLSDEAYARKRDYDNIYSYQRFGSSGSDSPHIRITARPHDRIY